MRTGGAVPADEVPTVGSPVPVTVSGVPCALAVFWYEPSTSATNTRVSLPETPSELFPLDPNPSFGGMVISSLLPARLPSRLLSSPEIVDPTVSGCGWPVDNWLIFLAAVPFQVYAVRSATARSPLATSVPCPLIRCCARRLAGGLILGIVTVGLVPNAPVTAIEGGGAGRVA